MADIPSRDQIKRGTKVGIETKEDQGTGKISIGIVKEILTSSNVHPHGIKVELEDGKVGRVKKLFSDNSIDNSSITSSNILKILDRYLDKESLQDLLSDFNLPYSKNKQELLNLIFQNKTVFEETVKELVDREKDELVEICEKCNFNSKGKVQELRERIVNNFLPVSELDAPDKTNTKTIPKSVLSIPKDEDTWNEFKSTFRVDYDRFSKGDGKKIHHKDVEKEIPITVSAMANKEGGTLFVGVDDDGNMLGLENDYDLLKNPNDDKFQRIVWQTIQKYIGNKPYVSKLNISLIEKNLKKICVITIPPADEPIVVHDNNTQESYVRIGPKSEKFAPLEFMKYCKKRFDD